MDNLVPSVPDTDKWKRLVSHLAKTSVEPSNEVSVVSTSPQVPMKSRKYKRRTKKVPRHTSSKTLRVHKKVKRLTKRKKKKKKVVKRSRKKSRH
jgi:hypothetical protein